VQLARDPYTNEARGHLPWLRYAIGHAERSNFWLATKRMLYERMHNYEALIFRALDARTVMIHNPTSRTIEGMAVRFAEPISQVHDTERRYIHIIDRHTVTLPALAPKTTYTLAAADDTPPAPIISQPNSNLLTMTTAYGALTGSDLYIQGHALRKSHVVVHHLRPQHTYIVTIEDARGRVRQRLTSRSDGKLALPILGQSDNLIPFQLTLHDA
jgi:hypothetical protein